MKFVVVAEEDGLRLDAVVAERCHCSRAEANRWIDDGQARLRGKKSRGGIRVSTGDSIEVTASSEKRPVAEIGPLSILREDAAFLALDKPAKMPTHPLRSGETGTLANRVLAKFPECGDASVDPREGGAAHRLDGETSGVILFARSRDVWTRLRDSFRNGEVAKEYLALVIGSPQQKTFEICAPLAHAGHRVRVRDDGAPAETHVEVLAQRGDFALVKASTSTGRMHQVRAHLAHVGHPLVGDEIYGGPASPLGHILHAHEIEFPHPITGARIRVVAPLPADRAQEIARTTGLSL